MGLPRHVRRNRAYWDRTSDAYQRRHGRQLNRRALAWGVWSLPERRVRVLGDVRGKGVLELGCGAAQWSIFLAKHGARPVGVDVSARQLGHAQELAARMGVRVPLVLATAEELPFREGTFDLVLSDHGALGFADPDRAVAEAARVLRTGGHLVFNMRSPLADLCWSPRTGRVGERLQAPYFGMRRFDLGDHVEFQLPYGEWIRLFRRHGLAVEDLVELRPPPEARTTFPDYAPLRWARRWPAENIWKVRKEPGLALHRDPPPRLGDDLHQVEPQA